MWTFTRAVEICVIAGPLSFSVLKEVAPITMSSHLILKASPTLLVVPLRSVFAILRMSGPMGRAQQTKANRYHHHYSYPYLPSQCLRRHLSWQNPLKEQKDMLTCMMNMWPGTPKGLQLLSISHWTWTSQTRCQPSNTVMIPSPLTVIRESTASYGMNLIGTTGTWFSLNALT